MCIPISLLCLIAPHHVIVWLMMTPQCSQTQAHNMHACDRRWNAAHSQCSVVFDPTGTSLKIVFCAQTSIANPLCNFTFRQNRMHIRFAFDFHSRKFKWRATHVVAETTAAHIIVPISRTTNELVNNVMWPRVICIRRKSCLQFARPPSRSHNSVSMATTMR